MQCRSDPLKQFCCVKLKELIPRRPGSVPRAACLELSTAPNLLPVVAICQVLTPGLLAASHSECVEDASHQPGLLMRLDRWTNLTKLMKWFREGSDADAAAELSFSPELTKDHRATIHMQATCIQRLLSAAKDDVLLAILYQAICVLGFNAILALPSFARWRDK